MRWTRAPPPHSVPRPPTRRHPTRLRPAQAPASTDRMRIRDHREDDTPEINLIPLIDVVLCLIIFFVVTTTFDARSVLKLQLPQANGQPADSQTKALSVLVNADGRYFIDDREALR